MNDSIKLPSKVYDSAIQTAANIIQYMDVDSRQEMIDALRSHVANYAEIEEKFKSLKEISAEYVQNKKIIQQRSNEDPEQENNDWAVERENLDKEYSKKIHTIEVDTSNNQNLRKFNQQIEQITSVLSGQQETPGDDNDDMVVTGSMNVICPISKTKMIEPMRNDICGHVYDKASVMEMIKSNSKSRCPLMGCNNSEFLRIDNLSPDIVTRLYLQRNP
ncbi:E3 SUMO-protein ligase NSE2 [Fopius arisanus]|uniref:E3 SUMO-protein ligase NSE2 n=1 Tax=Fopius arisanus TaxID=64838 RepID=A0A0C9RTB7_9HYME|nr:PREDICTED: E3 SUMO-protein ligase NSE2-like [Fopius arisanus]